MGFFSNLFTKSRNQSMFAFYMPRNAPSLATKNLLQAYALPWVNACIRAIATDVSTIELKLQKNTGSDWTDVDTHPAMDLLNQVNPTMTSDDLFYGTSAFVDLCGSAFWYVAYSNGSQRIKSQPTELWLMDPTRMTILRGGPDGVAGYEYRNEQGKAIQLKPWEVINFHDFNPEDMLRGTGLVKPAAVPIDIDTYASKYNRDFFFNSAVPGISLETEQTLNDEQYERIEQKWLEKFQGVGKSHLPAVLEGGLKVSKVSSTAQEMDFNEGKRLVRDEILAIFHTPKSILGITEDVNRANAEASEYVFAKRVVAPRMRFIATRLTEFYLTLWGLKSSEYRIVATDPVPQNVELQAKVKQIALQSGWLTRNEVRKMDGQEDIEGGDVLLVPNNYVPLTTAIKPPEPVVVAPPAGAPPPPTNAPKPKKDFKAAYSSIDERSAYISNTVNDASEQYERVYRVVARDAAKKLKGKKSFKDNNPNSSDVQETDLYRLLFELWPFVTVAFQGVMSKVLPPVFAHAATQTAAKVSADATFDATNHRVTSWLTDHGLKSATQVADNLKAEMTSILSQGVTDGKSVKDIAADLGKFFDDESQWRALRIARTEVLTTYAQGSIESARQMNLEEKRWVTSNGETAEVCSMNAAVGWIHREDAFPSGDLAPTAHPNCKCELEWRKSATQE
jgi:HK97 family phage portal protein